MFFCFVLGEKKRCGQRSGYVEVVNFDQEIVDQLYKLASVQLCSNTAGQILMDCMVNPPKPGDESYPTYESEKSTLFEFRRKKKKHILHFCYNFFLFLFLCFSLHLRIPEKKSNQFSYLSQHIGGSQLQPLGGGNVPLSSNQTPAKSRGRGKIH